MVTTGDSTRTLWELTPLQLDTKAPGAPTIAAVTRASGAAKSAEVSFTAPVDPGCGPITGYDITAKPLSGSGATITKAVGGAATTAVVEGLTANIRYNFTIHADNACGEGPTTWYVETLATSDAVAGAGWYGVCAVKSDSKMICLGREEYGNVLEFPTKWKQGNDVVSLVLNYWYGSALSRNGTLGVWGENIDIGCSAAINDPFCIPEGFESDVAQIHGWQQSLCITKTNGDMTCAGRVGRRPIDDPDFFDFDQLPGFTRFGFVDNTGSYGGFVTGVKLVKSSGDGGCVVYQNGNMRVWGDVADFATDEAAVPLPISYYSGIVDCGAGADGICALKANGDLACASELNPDATGNYRLLPIPETFDRGVGAVECARYGCCAWKPNGDFTCWGETTETGEIPEGSRGNGLLGSIPNFIAGINKYTWRTFSNSSDPPASGRRLQVAGGTSIRWPVMTEVVSFSMGEQNTCVIRKDGSLQCWGRNTQSAGFVNIDALQNELTLSGYDYLF